MNSPHKGQWREALVFSLICAWIKDLVNNREAGDLRRHRTHHDVIVINTINRGVYYIPFVMSSLGQIMGWHRTGDEPAIKIKLVHPTVHKTTENVTLLKVCWDEDVFICEKALQIVISDVAATSLWGELSQHTPTLESGWLTSTLAAQFNKPFARGRIYQYFVVITSGFFSLKRFKF